MPETIQIGHVGDRIKHERLKCRLTQRELASKVGVGTPHISKIEAGRENASDALLQKIATVIECEFEELLLTARRIPPDLMDKIASDPQQSLRFLRQWDVE
ncbi:MAG: helix-turn-helix transcriptional regulator [Chloroflexota bacterium]|nr:helix-turn-helix transcriptional regulator [Chloroflexota bacterium]